MIDKPNLPSNLERDIILSQTLPAVCGLVCSKR
jgi:hypothetical protein